MIFFFFRFFFFFFFFVLFVLFVLYYQIMISGIRQLSFKLKSTGTKGSLEKLYDQFILSAFSAETSIICITSWSNMESDHQLEPRG